MQRMLEQPIDLFQPEQRIKVFKTRESSPACRALEPALFFEPSQKLLEAPTSFLSRRYVQNGSTPSPETWEAAAYALQSWFEFLIAGDIRDWTTATRSDLLQYRDLYRTAISPRTGEAYSDTTISNRIGVICEFYADAARLKTYSGDLVQPEAHVLNLSTGRAGAVDSGTLGAKGLGPKVRRNQNTIRPFLQRDLKNFLVAAGPRASEADDVSLPCRDRLLCDLLWSTGLRVSEAMALVTYQFLALTPDSATPLIEYPISIRGKGGITGAVGFPSWLVEDILAYIHGERERDVQKGEYRGRNKQRLFVCNEFSNARGRPIGVRRAEQIIEEICFRTGLVQYVSKTDPDTREVWQERKAAHCPHDLRHTYAVLTYWAEKMAGNPEPWKKIQSQLRHAKLSTTVNTYLSFVEIFDGQEKLIDTRRLIFDA